MRRHSKLDGSTAARTGRLGETGEQLAGKVLDRGGFVNIRNLNREKMNFPFADIYAERNGRRYVISVKIRNKLEARTRRLNSRYKLGAQCYELARRAEEAMQAEAAWLAISLEPTVFNAYFGLLSQLGGSRGISMTALAVSNYECLCGNQSHDFDYAALMNVYEPLTSEDEQPETWVTE